MLAKRVSKSKRPLRLLVVSLELPKPDQRGGDGRFFALLRLLAKQHRVVLCPLINPEDAGEATRYRAMLRRAGVRILSAAWVFGLERTLLERAYDAVLFEFWQRAELGASLVLRHQPWARIIVDSVDIHFRREEAGLSLGISDPTTVEANKQGELAVYRMAHAVVCVSDEERRFLEAQGGIARCYTIPNVVMERPRTVRPREPELLFLGGFQHFPNCDGLLWFVQAIWPAIRAAVPNARLTVVGSHPTAEVMDLAQVAGVDVIGYAPELEPYMDRASLMVAPLRYGAGMKNKVTEAFASSLAVVTTTVGAQGLDVATGEHLMIADEPEEFARRVIELLGDPKRAEQIGQSGRRLASALCSPAVIESCLESMLAAVVDGRRPIIPSRDWLIQSARTHALWARFSLGRIYRSAFRSRAGRLGTAPEGVGFEG
jgi:O-antigen biosynthesis protein